MNDNDIQNITRVNMDTISILKQFVDTYCDGTQLKDLIGGEAGVKLSKIREVSKHIMSCCESLLPLISDEKAKPHEYERNPNFPVSKTASEQLVYDSCKTIDCNIYWHNWELNEDHPLSNTKYCLEDYNGHKIKDENGKYIEYKGHGESIYLLSSIRKLCKESNYGSGYKPYFSYKDMRFDEDDITGDITKDVLSLMYHILYDHCVQKAFFRHKIERKNKNKIISFIEEDLESNSSSLNIVILRECIVRVKMTIFLRIFQGSCCSGRSIDRGHWSEIQNLCRLIDKMSAYKYSLEIPDDEDEDIEEEQEKEIVNFIGHKRSSNNSRNTDFKIMKK